MNQILKMENKNNKLIKIFKIQFIISFVAIIALFIYILNQNIEKNKENEITSIASQNAKISMLFESNVLNYDNTYFCKLKIEKINLDYYVYNGYSDELLKVLPCKFYGDSLTQDGNICIVGHNYFDDRFFGNLDKLEIGDEIVLEDLNGIDYKYVVYNIYEINENDIYEVIKKDENLKTVTLCTCTISKNIRLIVKAKYQQN